MNFAQFDRRKLHLYLLNVAATSENVLSCYALTVCTSFIVIALYVRAV